MASVPDRPEAITCPICHTTTDDYLTSRSDGLTLCARCHSAARTHAEEAVQLERSSVVGMAARQLANEVYGVKYPSTPEERLLEDLDDCRPSKAGPIRRLLSLNDAAKNFRLIAYRHPYPPFLSASGSAGGNATKGAELAALAEQASICAECGVAERTDTTFLNGRALCRDCREKARADEAQRAEEHARLLRTTAAGQIIASLSQPDVRQTLLAAASADGPGEQHAGRNRRRSRAVSPEQVIEAFRAVSAEQDRPASQEAVAERLKVAVSTIQRVVRDAHIDWPPHGPASAESPPTRPPTDYLPGSA